MVARRSQAPRGRGRPEMRLLTLPMAGACGAVAASGAGSRGAHSSVCTMAMARGSGLARGLQGNLHERKASESLHRELPSCVKS